MVDATFVDHGTAPGIRKWATPFDGIRGPNDAEAYYQPLSSGGDYVALAENTYDEPNTDLVGHAALLRKSDYSEVVPYIGIGDQNWIPGDGINVAGHASATSVVSGSGKIIYRRGGHAQPLGAVIVPTPYDLLSAEALPNPAGGDVRADYRRGWRAPDGRLWYYYRGNDGKGEMYILDEGTDTLTRVGAPFLDFGANTGHYGIKAAFVGTTIYCSVEVLLTATSGFPCNVIGAIKSEDNGATWTNLEGTAITLPVNQADVTLIAGGTTSDAVVMAQVAVGPAGDPVFAFGWENPAESDTFLATYVARWDSVSETFSYVRMYPAIGPGTDILGEWQNSKIIPHMLWNPTNGNVLIVMKEVGTGVTQRLVALANYHDEDETVWHRWVLDATDLYTGAYVDYNAIEDDQKIRTYPVTSGDLVPYDQVSEIWEWAVPGFDVWADLQEFDGLLVNSYDDEAVAGETTYRYRVRANDSETGLSSEWSDWVTVTTAAEGEAAVSAFVLVSGVEQPVNAFVLVSGVEQPLDLSTPATP